MNMTAPVANPHLMYWSPGISEASALQLQALGYCEERLRLLRAGLPVTYEEHGNLVLEYPDGRRVIVVHDRVYDEAGVFVRYDFRAARELPPQVR